MRVCLVATGLLLHIVRMTITREGSETTGISLVLEGIGRVCRPFAPAPTRQASTSATNVETEGVRLRIASRMAFRPSCAVSPAGTSLFTRLSITAESLPSLVAITVQIFVIAVPRTIRLVHY